MGCKSNILQHQRMSYAHDTKSLLKWFIRIPIRNTRLLCMPLKNSSLMLMLGCTIFTRYRDRKRVNQYPFHLPGQYRVRVQSIPFISRRDDREPIKQSMAATEGQSKKRPSSCPRLPEGYRTRTSHLQRRTMETKHGDPDTSPPPFFLLPLHPPHVPTP